MDTVAASRLVRELESQDRIAEAYRLRWAIACALSGDVAVSHPALTGDEDLDAAPSCLLGPALREAEAAGDLATVAALLSVLASPERPSRRAA